MQRKGNAGYSKGEKRREVRAGQTDNIGEKYKRVLGRSDMLARMGYPKDGGKSIR
jgi:hypothetical protein